MTVGGVADDLTGLLPPPYNDDMNAIQRTITMSAARRLTLDLALPDTIPAGGTRFEIVLIVPPKDDIKAKYKAARLKLRELCKDSSLTVESFLAGKHTERVLEAEQEKRASGSMPL